MASFIEFKVEDENMDVDVVADIKLLVVMVAPVIQLLAKMSNKNGID